MQDEFLDALRALGGSAGNGRLRETLGWDEATYDGVRLALIDAGMVKPGRGRGGSVALADGQGASDEGGAPEKVAAVKRAPRDKATKSGNGGDLGFEAELFKAADKLRGNLEPSEYKHVALGLIFLKYISEAFEAQYEKLQAEEYADPEDPEEYLAANVFWVPPEARWANLQANAKRPEIEYFDIATKQTKKGDIGGLIDNAMEAIEQAMGGVTTDAVWAAELVGLFAEGLDQDGLPSGWRQGTARDLIEFNPRETMRGGTLAPYSDMASLPTQGTVADLPVLRPFGSGMRFRNGDALLARITPCLENGKGAWVDFLSDEAPVGWGSTEFIVLRGRAGTPPPFGYLLTRDADFRQHAIQSMTGTSGRQRAQAESLEMWPMALPPPPVLDAFRDLVSPLFARITAAAEESRTLAETRDYMLPRLMSGEVRVGDAAQEIAA